MKKTYFAPNTNVVKVRLQQMIAASPGTLTLDKNATQITGSDGIGSRQGGDFWDDEDE